MVMYQRLPVKKKKDSLQRRKINLMAKHPYCYWCGRKLSFNGIIRGGKLPPDYPTIDHIQTRFSGKRKELAEEGLRVLSCSECNFERSNKELKQSPFKQKWKSASFGRSLTLLNWFLRFARGHKRYRK